MRCDERSARCVAIAPRVGAVSFDDEILEIIEPDRVAVDRFDEAGILSVALQQEIAGDVAARRNPWYTASVRVGASACYARFASSSSRTSHARLEDHSWHRTSRSSFFSGSISETSRASSTT